MDKKAIQLKTQNQGEKFLVRFKRSGSNPKVILVMAYFSWLQCKLCPATLDEARQFLRQ